MRIEHSIKNSAAALMSQFVSMALQVVTRTVFMYTLGKTYLGLNGLFLSILSLLSLSELGVGTAITYALYKPLAERDERKVAALMTLYGKAYKVIGAIIAVLGLTIMPFWRLIVEAPEGIPYLDVMYLMFLFNTVASYFLAYKRTLITADQRDAINAINYSTFLIIQNILQIIWLVLTNNYFLYLGTQIATSITANLVLSRKADKMYPFLRTYRNEKLDKESISGIKHNVSAMLMHQIGSVIVTGTDNMLIGHVSLDLLGIYMNYTLITQTLSTILRQVFSSITASVGNLIAMEGKDRQYEMYLNIWLVNFWVYGLCSISMAVLINPFIHLWAPEGYVLSDTIVMLIVINFFLFGMRQTNIMYVNTAGLFWELRFKSIIEAVINLVTSIYFLDALHLGVVGVLLGTVISTLSTNFWWEPYAVYRHCFGKSVKTYFFRYAVYAAVLVGSFALAKFICGLLPGAGWLNLFAQAAVCVIIVNAVFLLAFFKTNQFSYMKTVFAKVGNMFIGIVRSKLPMATESKKM